MAQDTQEAAWAHLGWVEAALTHHILMSKGSDAESGRQ